MCCLEFNNIPPSKLLSKQGGSFFKTLIKPMYSYVEGYKIEELYQHLEQLNAYRNNKGDFITNQKNGTCAFGCLKVMLRYLLRNDLKKYKKIRVAMLALGIKSFANNCLKLYPQLNRWIINQGHRDLTRRLKKELASGVLTQYEYDGLMKGANNIKHAHCCSQTS